MALVTRKVTSMLVPSRGLRIEVTNREKKGKYYIEGCRSSRLMARDNYPNQTSIAKLKTKFLSDPDISESNKKAVIEFLAKQKALKDIGDFRVRKIVSVFKTILTKITPSFELVNASEEDLLSLHQSIQNMDKKPNTKSDYIKIVRRYYKVMEGRGVRNPDKIDFFQNIKRPQITKTADDLISREEYAKLLSSCINQRDKAIISLLYEGGLRCGELLNLSVKDVSFKDDGVEVVIREIEGNKTGARPLWLIECYSNLKGWVDYHPVKDNPEAPLFITLERHGVRGVHTKLDAYSLRSMIHKRAIKGGLDSNKFHPHAFRHTCATNLAVRGLTESQLCAFMGWRIGSSTAAVYVHMGGEGIKTAYKKALGLPTDETKAVKICHRCGYQNGYLTQECGRCKTSLDSQARMLEEGKKDRQLKWINVIFELNQDLRDEAMKFSKDNYERIEEVINAGKRDNP